VYTPPLLAQTAKKLDCERCVGKRHLDRKAVRKEHISTHAVASAHIADGAVKVDKLAAGAVAEAKLAAGAVTRDKLGESAVTSAKLASGAVTRAKLSADVLSALKLGEGAVTAKQLHSAAVSESKLQDNAVVTAKINDSAVTNSKLADGAITAAKLADDAVFVSTKLVSPVGAPTENCTALLSVLGNITDNGDERRYLLKLEPGLYDCDNKPVTMKPYVTIDGSGVRATEIRGRVNGFKFDDGVVTGAGNSELRNLTVRHTGGEGVITAIGVHTGSDGDMLVKNVRVIVGDNKKGSNFGVLIGGTNNGSARLHNVTVESNIALLSVGIQTDFKARAEAELINVVSVAKSGDFRSGLSLETADDEITARNSVFAGANASASGGVGTVNLVLTQLIGPASAAPSGTIRCIGAYDGDFRPLSRNCQLAAASN
ncbi:MAG: hypothetical protein ACR2RB_12490, partial [Gammaproteobacteria bacterium]